MNNEFITENTVKLAEIYYTAFENTCAEGFDHNLEARILDNFFNHCLPLIENSEDKPNLMKLIVSLPLSSHYKEIFLNNLIGNIIKQNIEQEDHEKIYKAVQSLYEFETIEEAQALLDKELGEYVEEAIKRLNLDQEIEDEALNGDLTFDFDE